jgi:hydrogenase expression/formation protein HypC
MCLAIPAQVTHIEGTVAKVEFSGNTVEADITLVPDVAIGDYVIVHAGMAIEKYDRNEALRTLELFREMAQMEGTQ